MAKTNSILTKDINLIPKYKIDAKLGKKSYKRALLIMTGVLVLSMAAAFGLWNHTSSLQGVKTRLNQDIARMQETQDRANRLEHIKTQIEAREAYDENISKTNTSMIMLLEYLERERSNGVYLVGFSDSVTRDGLKQITINGGAVDKFAIDNFMGKLEESALFSSVYIQTITQSANTTITDLYGEIVSNEPLQTFNIICILA